MCCDSFVVWFTSRLPYAFHCFKLLLESCLHETVPHLLPLENHQHEYIRSASKGRKSLGGKELGHQLAEIDKVRH